MPSSTKPIKVALWITCLVDWMRPRIAEASVKILESFNCEVLVPNSQTCCGQPAYNSGDRESALLVARQTLIALRGYDYIVAPSGSCTGMITKHYPDLFRDYPDDLHEVSSLTGKVFELTQFLLHELKVLDKAIYPQWSESLITTAHPFSTLTYHDSCAGLRELGIKQEPRLLIARMQAERAKFGLIEKWLPMNGEEDCCGFGGTFAAKYGDISTFITARKCDNIMQTNAEAVVLGDLGCIMNIEGKINHLKLPTKVLHIAEYLAGM